MKKYTIPLLLSLLIAITSTQSVKAQELGANFNENLELVYPSQVKQAEVKWIRAFVNVMESLKIADGIITGINEEAINKIKLDSLIASSKIQVDDEKVKLIFTFKFEFDDTFMGRVPEADSKEMEFVYSAMKKILQKQNVGSYINILVVGNEPMWETPKDDASVKRLVDFTNKAVSLVNTWKSKEWDYEIYVGALNRFGELTDNNIRNAILTLAKTNKLVDGIDMHPHMANISELEQTFKSLRVDEGFTKEVIVTEFSMHRLFVDHKKDELGIWGTEHGYPSSMKLYEWINRYIENSSAGKNNSKDEFMSYFNAQSWYPQNWFTSCWDAFEKYNIKAATYGFVRKLNPNYKVQEKTSDMWIVNAYFNQALFGSDSSGFWVTNPMVYKEFNTALENN